MILGARGATSGANVRTRKLRSLPNNAIPLLKVENQRTRRPALQNCLDAHFHIAKRNRIRPLATDKSHGEYNRLLENARNPHTLIGRLRIVRREGGTVRHFRSKIWQRPGTSYGKSRPAPSARLAGQMAVREIINADGAARLPAPTHCTEHFPD